MVAKNTLTPAELFDYRLAALMGYADIDTMKASMSARSYAGWQRYWEEEPWGPWRDNLHASLIARELRRLRQPAFSKLDVFFYKNPKGGAKETEKKVLTALSAMAQPVSAKEAQRRMKKTKVKYNARKKRRGSK